MVKRDRIFVFVTAAVLGNVAFFVWTAIGWLIEDPTQYTAWFYLVADIVALLGVFYFIRTYLKGRKLTKRREKALKQDTESQDASG